MYLFESPAESLKHPLHVASLLHGDDPGVVLLVDPDQEVLLVVVPETIQGACCLKSQCIRVSGSQKKHDIELGTEMRPWQNTCLTYELKLNAEVVNVKPLRLLALSNMASKGSEYNSTGL